MVKITLHKADPLYYFFCSRHTWHNPSPFLEQIRGVKESFQPVFPPGTVQALHFSLAGSDQNSSVPRHLPNHINASELTTFAKTQAHLWGIEPAVSPLGWCRLYHETTGARRQGSKMTNVRDRLRLASRRVSGVKRSVHPSSAAVTGTPI